MKKHIQIAIDGPAGAGKSTIAKIIAKKLDILYLDTGALYRSIGYFVKKSGLEAEKALKKLKLEIKYVDFAQQIIVNGENVTDLIRTPEMSLMASSVSKIPEVREFLLETQREIARNNSVIMDGRDIATVIMPDADVKIFLTASAEKRAKRRFNETKEDVTFEQVLADVIARDTQDTTRKIAPLRPAFDSVLLNTTDMTLDESINRAIEIITEKIG
ncbi:MAG: (d)CMP kinase [Clostridia bacterium]